MATGKLKVGIYGLTSCAGCQLEIIDCEMELVDIFMAADIESFVMAKSDNHEGKLDVALVEGSVSTEKDRTDLLDIRERSGTLVAIGLCAVAGGVQGALRDAKAWQKQIDKVYGTVAWNHTTPCPSRPLSEFVKVDFNLPGCPIDKEQFLPTLSRIVGLNPPELPSTPVCMECKWKENDCLLNAGKPCLGPVTASGCGAVCPSHNLPCVGCWGPATEPNRDAVYTLLRQKGFSAEFIIKRMATFSGSKIDEFAAKLKEVQK
jgi:sulfhydrogenase subunit delta